MTPRESIMVIIWLNGIMDFMVDRNGFIRLPIFSMTTCIKSCLDFCDKIVMLLSFLVWTILKILNTNTECVGKLVSLNHIHLVEFVTTSNRLTISFMSAFQITSKTLWVSVLIILPVNIGPSGLVWMIRSQ